MTRVRSLGEVRLGVRAVWTRSLWGANDWTNLPKGESSHEPKMRGGYEAVIVVVAWGSKEESSPGKSRSLLHLLVFTSAAVGMEPNNGSLTQNK